MLELVRFAIYLINIYLLECHMSNVCLERVPWRATSLSSSVDACQATERESSFSISMSRAVEHRPAFKQQCTLEDECSFVW